MIDSCRRRFIHSAFAISGTLLFTAHLASAQSVPKPESVLGHKPGDDFYLASYDDARGYFRKVAEVSNRIKLINVGKTTRGAEWEIAIISAPENLANLERYKDISRRLADGRGLNDEAARALAREGKAIVHLDGGLHSTEVAGGSRQSALHTDWSQARTIPRSTRSSRTRSSCCGRP